MSDTLAQTSVPATQRHSKPRLRGRRRLALTAAGALLALIGAGGLVKAGTASAQPVNPPPGACTQTCNQPPSGVSTEDWNAALEAADFWANHYIDWNGWVRTGNWGSGVWTLEHWQGHGWPAAINGGHWYAIHSAVAPGRYDYLYYGGRFHDYGGLISNFERYHGGTAATSFSSGSGRTAPYVEYDLDYWSSTSPAGGRGARRIVRNPNTGNVYVTYDHYTSFYFLGRF